MYDPTGPVRTDETWHRLREWTMGQPLSERLAAQIVEASDYKAIDPSHPLGGPDGGRDGICKYAGEEAIYAVYFARGKQSFSTIRNKFESDLESASKHSIRRLAFVTNQELTLSQRETLQEMGGQIVVELFHLERVTALLDTPKMHSVREQFLGISSGLLPIIVEVTFEGFARQFINDREVLDTFVRLREKRIREASDVAHARVAEEEEAQRRREKGLNWGRPSVGIDAYSSNLGLSWMKSEEAPKHEPLSDEEIAVRVTQYEDELESRWDACQDYLAGVAWPSMQFKIKNVQKSFLKNVEIVLTFQGARAVEAGDLQNFDIYKVQDPNWKPQRDMYDLVDYSYFNINREDEEFSWSHNENGNLEVILNLSSLRPHPEWRSREHHPQIILVVPSGEEGSSVTLTYTVTAEGHGEFFESEPIDVPILLEPMKEALQRAVKLAGSYRGD